MATVVMRMRLSVMYVIRTLSVLFNVKPVGTQTNHWALKVKSGQLIGLACISLSPNKQEGSTRGVKSCIPFSINQLFKVIKPRVKRVGHVVLIRNIKINTQY